MNNTDFLKSCTTNVRAVEDIDKIRYTVYGPRDRNISPLHKEVARLRGQNIFCAGVKEQLWTFDFAQLDGESNIDTEEGGFEEVERALVGSDTAKQVADGRSVRDVLLEAIEGSITYSIANSQGMCRLGRWQWLFTSSEEGEDGGQSIILRLHAHLSSSSTLYISTTTQPCPLQPVGQTVPWREVVIAPSGRLATLVSPQDSESADGVQRHRHVVGSETWKSKVAEMLEMEGVYLDTNEQWLVIAIAGSSPEETVLWPPKLCFSIAASFQHNNVLKGERTWRHWFGGSDDRHNTYRNPLLVAEEWYTSAIERAKAVAGDVPGEQEYTTGHSTSIIADTPLAIASPYNQRLVDQQAAMSGIYPTPPDGMLPAHVATQQSTSDCITGPIIGGNGTENGSMNHDIPFVDASESPQATRGHSIGSPTGLHEYQPHSDDLFGDMGEMDFGANEVGDEDFDYFDEPDDVATDGQVEMAGQDKDADMDDYDELNEQNSEEQPVVQPDVAVPDAYDTDQDQTTRADQTVSPEYIEAVESRILRSDPVEHGASPVRDTPETTKGEVEKPLSPFGIRERLLPMPIPASAAQADGRPNQKESQRSSTFGPVTFNENLVIDTNKYTAQPDFIHDNGAQIEVKHVLDITLPKRLKKLRPEPPKDPDSGVADMMDSESEEDSYYSLSSSSEDEDLPPRLPWHTKKRKRSSAVLEGIDTSEMGKDPWSSTQAEDALGPEDTSERMAVVLDSIMSPVNSDLQYSSSRTELDPWNALICQRTNTLLQQLPAIDELLELNKLDLVYTAQLVSEQAVSAIPQLVSAVQDFSSNIHSERSALQAVLRSSINNAVSHAIPDIEECGPSKLALIKEPPPRPPAQPGKSSGMPRPPQRESSMNLGSDYFSIPPPFVRVQRSTDTWEMLPPAVSFWSALGLGPVSGPKDIRTVAVLPGNEDLIGLVTEFVGELSRVYKGWKLGSVKHMAEYAEEMEEFEAYEEGMILVGLDDESDSPNGAIKAYAAACTELGESLAIIGQKDPDRTLVVYMVDPFEHSQSQQHLSACFWLLYKAYRDNTPKTHRPMARSDLVLQILPVSLIASPGSLVILDAQQMGTLATEIYERCPPSSKAAPTSDLSSSLSILTAPAVELASHPPKRIGFQLSAEPPSDLLHEGSVLHVAYAMSKDEQWLTTCWTDATGRYQNTSSACLRGRSLRDGIAEIWDQTLDILSAREVTWRIFVVTTEHVDISVQKCWKAVVAARPRKQMLHVTLINVQQEPSVQLMPAAALENDNIGGGRSGQAAGFLTPATTPQGSTLTVSPDASGQSNTPLTPAPTEPATGTAETEPDAHLVDLTDESWAMLLAPSITSHRPVDSASGMYSNSTSGTCLASGLLFKRGSATAAHLGSLGVSLQWDIRLRPNGAIDEGPAKQAEATLRDVLRMYRNLSLLGKIRGIHATENNGGSAAMPVHLTSAIRGAQALDGFLA